MNPYFYLLGHPYNPTSNEYFETLPSSVKLTGMLKKVLKTNYNSIDQEDFVQLINNSLMALLENEDSDSYLYIDFELDEIDREAFDETVSRVYRYAKKLNGKTVNKLLLSYLPPYSDVIDEHYSTSSGTLSPKWLSPIMNGKQGIRPNDQAFIGMVMGSDLSLDDAMPYESDEDGVDDDKILSEEEKNIFGHINLFFESKSIQYNLLSKMFVSKSIFLARESATFKQAAELIWCLARKEETPEIFLAFYHFYKEQFTESRFPFLHFGNIELLESKLHESQSGRLSVIDRRKLTLLINKIGEVLEEDNHIESIFKIGQLLNRQTNLPEKSVIVNYVQCEIDTLFKEILEADSTSSIVKDMINSVPRLNQNIELLDNNDLFNKLLPFINLIPRIIAASHVAMENISSIVNEHSKRNELNQEALELGKDPMKNIERLQEISLELTEIKEVEEAITDKIIGSLSGYLDILTDKINDFNVNDLSVDEEDKDNPDVNQQKRISQLERQLADKTTELSATKEKLHQKEVALSTLKKGAVQEEQNKPIVTYEDLSSLVSNNSVESTVSILNKLHGTIVLSHKAKQELSSLRNFQKHDLLMLKLGILSSKEFISTYTNKGSGACFEYLTSKELSFQESKTVKERNERTFKFPDGKERDCKAHLKICSSTKEQHQLRIYFKIENSKLFIGMITKHLDCA